MNRFAWLLRREWMQHHRGWLMLALIPFVLALLVLPVGSIQLDEGPPPAAMLALLASSVYLFGLLMLTAAAVVFQTAGLARRDQQDRSIEFWVSLPTGHAQSVVATLLMHFVLMPMLVLAIAFACAQVVGAIVVVKLLGVAGLGSLLDPGWWTYAAALLLRLAIGVVVAALWISPLALALMASASWLKGWGIPALVAGVVALGLLVRQFLGSGIVFTALQRWGTESLAALLPLVTKEDEVKRALESSSMSLDNTTAWILGDIVVMLRDLVTPAFAAGLLVAAIGFGLVVWRRAGGTPLPLPRLRRAA